MGSRFPPTWIVRLLGSAARRRLSDGLSSEGPSPRLHAVTRSAGCLDRALQAAFGDPDLALGLVDRADEIVAVGADVGLGERGDAGTVLLRCCRR